MAAFAAGCRELTWHLAVSFPVGRLHGDATQTTVWLREITCSNFGVRAGPYLVQTLCGIYPCARAKEFSNIRAERLVEVCSVVAS